MKLKVEQVYLILYYKTPKDKLDLEKKMGIFRRVTMSELDFFPRKSQAIHYWMYFETEYHKWKKSGQQI